MLKWVHSCPNYANAKWLGNSVTVITDRDHLLERRSIMPATLNRGQDRDMSGQERIKAYPLPSNGEPFPCG